MVMSYVSLCDLSQVQCPCKQMKQYYTIKNEIKIIIKSLYMSFLHESGQDFYIPSTNAQGINTFCNKIV